MSFSLTAYLEECTKLTNDIMNAVVPLIDGNPSALLVIEAMSAAMVRIIETSTIDQEQKPILLTRLAERIAVYTSRRF